MVHSVGVTDSVDAVRGREERVGSSEPDLGGFPGGAVLARAVKVERKSHVQIDGLGVVLS